MNTILSKIKEIYIRHHDDSSILMMIDKTASFFYFHDDIEQLISLPVGYEDISSLAIPS